MHRKLVWLVCLLCFAPAASLSAAEPSVILRAASLDGLIADLRHLFQKAGREEEGKEFEKAMQARTGPKGLEGVDTQKPFGFSAELKVQLDQSPFMVLLPIADESAFLKFVGSLGHQPKKQADGSYRVTVEGIPFITQAMFRFAHGYVYAMLKITDNTQLPAEADLPKPEIALGKPNASVSLVLNVGEVPPPLRKIAVSMLGLQLGGYKSDMDADPLLDAAIDDATVWMKSLLEEGQRVELHLGLDTKKEQLRLEMTATAREETALAKDIAALGALQSPAASVIQGDAVLRGSTRLIFPNHVSKTLNTLIDKNINDLLDLLQAHERENVEPLAKALMPTFQAGGVDLAAQMHGPDKAGRYAVVLGVGVKDGKKLEDAIQTGYKALSDRSRRGLKLDADKVGTINIHQADQERIDAKTKQLLGEGPVYFALRDDVLLLAAGADALATLKQALGRKPVVAPPLRVEMGLQALASLLAVVDPEMKNAPQAAKEAFLEGNNDRVSLEATGGAKMSLKITLPTAAIAFASALDKARASEK
jgi:hypothetical protein